MYRLVNNGSIFGKVYNIYKDFLLEVWSSVLSEIVLFLFF